MEEDPPQEVEKKEKKELVLMRGLPGSGKSTKAKKIAGNVGVVYSTDDFFMINGKYMYDSKLIGDNHQKNFARTVEAMKEGKPLIIVDNTNIKLWEMKKYVIAGEELGYQIRIEQADAPWAFNFKQCAKRNNHEVPEQTCKKMLDNYETCNSLEDIKNAKDFFRGRKK